MNLGTVDTELKLPNARVRSPRSRLTWRGVLLSLFLCGWLLVMNQLAQQEFYSAATTQAKFEIAPVLLSEYFAWKAANLPLLRNTFDPDAANGWRESQVEYFSEFNSWSALPFPITSQEPVDGELRSGVLRVDLKVGSESQTFHEVRYYRRHGGGWQSTDGRQAFSLQPIVRSSAHFKIKAFGLDDSTVNTTVAGLEEFYGQVERDLDEQQVLAGDAPLELEINPPPYPALFGAGGDGTWGAQGTNALRAPIAFWSVRHILDGTDSRYTAIRKKNLNVLAEGIVAWEARQFAPPPVMWLSAEKTLVRDARAHGYFLPLSDLTRARVPVGGMTDAGPLLNMEAWTVASYIAQRFGRLKLADTVAGVVTYNTWDDLIQNVFEIKLEDFQHGWEAYVDDWLRE